MYSPLMHHEMRDGQLQVEVDGDLQEMLEQQQGQIFLVQPMMSTLFSKEIT